MDSLEKKAIVRRLLNEVICYRNLEIVEELVDDEFVELDPPGWHVQGRDGLRAWWEAFLHGFPDADWTLQDQVAEGDKVVTVFTWTGTHREEFAAIPATNRHVRVTTVMVHRFADDRIIECRSLYDELGLLQQLGDIPPPGGVRRG